MLTTTRTQSKEKHATNTSTSFKHLLLLLPPLRSVWPDLAKFHHFVKILKVFGNFSTVYLVFAQYLNLLWIFCAIGQIFIVMNGKKLERIISLSGHTACDDQQRNELYLLKC